MTDDGFCICSALATPHELPGVHCGCRGRLRLLLENFTLGSEANELAYGISGVGGMPEPCNTPIQPGIVGMSFNINAQHFAGQPIHACSLPKVLILELGGDMFFLDFHVISNFWVPYNTGHGVGLSQLRLNSIPLASACCKHQDAAPRRAPRARMRSNTRSPKKFDNQPIG